MTQNRRRVLTSQRSKQVVVAVLALTLGAVRAQADDGTRVYRIGNSLTWDSQPAAIAKLAGLRGYKHVEGFHINCGQTLERIWHHPQEICVKPAAPFGTFRDALSKHSWTAVTFQPHPGAGATLATDAMRIGDFIKLTQQNPKNASTRFYVYASWPSRRLGPYAKVWTQDTPDVDDTPSLQTQVYFQHLMARLRTATSAEINLIPVGEVLFRLDQRMRSGRMPGYKDVHQLYRDQVHLTVDLGRYVAGATTFAVIHDANPDGLHKPESVYGNDKAFSPPMYKAIHSAIWDVVTSDPFTGVGREQRP